MPAPHGDPEDRTTVRPGGPHPGGGPQGAGAGYSRLTDESLWQRPEVRSHRELPPSELRGPQQRTGASQARPNQTRPNQNRQAQSRQAQDRPGGRPTRTPAPPGRTEASAPGSFLVLAVLVVVSLAMALHSPPVLPEGGGKVAPRQAMALVDKSVTQARLPDQLGVLRRDRALQEQQGLPAGHVDHAHYRDQKRHLYAIAMTSTVSSLSDYESSSGLLSKNRFGPVSCGRVDGRVQCAMLMRGGLLVVMSGDPHDDMGQVAQQTRDLYRTLP